MRGRLLETTVSLMSGARPGRPTTQALADAAHVSIGTVYRYFSGMDAILAELRDAAIREISSDLAAAVGRGLDRDLRESVEIVVETLTAAFERHAPILRASLASVAVEQPTALMAEVEKSMRPLGTVLPARHRPDLGPEALDDLVFITMGAAASICLRIALQRRTGADRTAMLATASRMLTAAIVG